MNVGDDIIWHVEIDQGLIKLEAVIQPGNLGVGDGEACDVGVEGDRDHIQCPCIAIHPKTEMV